MVLHSKEMDALFPPMDRWWKHEDPFAVPSKERHHSGPLSFHYCPAYWRSPLMASTVLGIILRAEGLRTISIVLISKRNLPS